MNVKKLMVGMKFTGNKGQRVEIISFHIYLNEFENQWVTAVTYKYEAFGKSGEAVETFERFLGSLKHVEAKELLEKS